MCNSPSNSCEPIRTSRLLLLPAQRPALIKLHLGLNHHPAPSFSDHCPCNDSDLSVHIFLPVSHTIATPPSAATTSATIPALGPPHAATYFLSIAVWAGDYEKATLSFQEPSHIVELSQVLVLALLLNFTGRGTFICSHKNVATV